MPGRYSSSSVVAEVQRRGLEDAGLAPGLVVDSYHPQQQYVAPYRESLPTSSPRPEDSPRPQGDLGSYVLSPTPTPRAQPAHTLPVHPIGKRYDHGAEGLFTIQDEEEAIAIPANIVRRPKKRVLSPSVESARSSVSAETAVYSPQLEKSYIQPLLEELAVGGTAEGRDIFVYGQTNGVMLSATQGRASNPEQSISTNGNRGATPKPCEAGSSRSLPATPPNVASQPITGSKTEYLIDPSLIPRRSKPSSVGSSSRLKRNSVLSRTKDSPNSPGTQATSPSPGSSRSKADITSEPSLSLPRTPYRRLVLTEPARNGDSQRAAHSRVRKKATPARITRITSQNSASTSTHTTNYDKRHRQLQSITLSSTSNPLLGHQTRSLNERKPRYDVRQLDGIEVAEGVELATQNTDGRPVPEFEAEKVNDLPTPPGIQEGSDLSSITAHSDLSTRADRLRAASPPPPPNYDPEKVRQIQLRAANRGRSMNQSHFANDSSNPVTKFRDHLEEAIHAVKEKVQGSDEPFIETVQPSVVPEPEIKGPGSIPESVVIGPPVNVADDLLPYAPSAPLGQHHLPKHGRDSWPFLRDRSNNIDSEQPFLSGSAVRDQNPGDLHKTYQNKIGEVINEPSYFPRVQCEPLSDGQGATIEPDILFGEGPPSSGLGSSVSRRSVPGSGTDSSGTQNVVSLETSRSDSTPPQTHGRRLSLGTLKNLIKRLIPGIYDPKSKDTADEAEPEKPAGHPVTVPPPDVMRDRDVAP